MSWHDTKSAALLRADLDINGGVSLSLEGGLQALFLHAGLHSDQDGLDLPRPLCYAASHLAGTCMLQCVWYAALQRRYQSRASMGSMTSFLCVYS